MENRGYSALMLAAAKDQEEIAASILLANRADVNQGVPESLAGNPELFYTPLQVAIEDAIGDSNMFLS